MAISFPQIYYLKILKSITSYHQKHESNETLPTHVKIETNNGLDFEMATCDDKARRRLRPRHPTPFDSAHASNPFRRIRHRLKTLMLCRSSPAMSAEEWRWAHGN